MANDPDQRSDTELARASAEERIAEKYTTRYRNLSRTWRYVTNAITAIVIGLAINQIFNLGFFVGEVVLNSRYLFVFAGLVLSMLFIWFPAAASAPRDRVPWYDVLLTLATAAIFAYFAVHAESISYEAWEYSAPLFGTILAFCAWLIVLEAGRRAGGLPILAIALIISLYPLYADEMPSVIAGVGMGLRDAANFHVYSAESLFGIPMQVAALLLFGFLLLGVALQRSGGGQFFIDLAFALLGKTRGGPAKVAIFSSGLMGSMSGGPVTNVLTTGPLSIPAMRKVGFSRGYAAGVEACASTGGVLMPPIMGATAFVMADFLSITYVEVALAAIIPSILYFFGLFMQIDAYAARNNIRGLEEQELPRLWSTLKSGWYFILVFALLIWMLVFQQRESVAPFYATGLLLVINQCTTRRWSLSDLGHYISDVGKMLAELIGILAAIGLIIGALQVTGMAGTLTNDLVYIAGDSVLVLLVMGALTSFILGIGMTVTAAYIFLAIILAPALINAGLNPLASHMFIMYWGMLSFITPPVALAAFVAASIAKVSGMRAGFEAMRLGSIIYFIPFFFVFNPALLLQGSVAEIAIVAVTALIGVWLLSSALQGYLIFLGIIGMGAVGWTARAMVMAAGILLVAPGGGMIGITHSFLALGSAALLAVAATLVLIQRRLSGESLRFTM